MSTDRRPLLLIVDDDASSAVMLGRLLRGDGYDTEVEADGSAALARLDRAPAPDAVITDFHVPNVDGLAIGRYAQSCHAGIPIFVVTGDPHAVEVAEAAETAAQRGLPVELITKPIDYARLVRRLQQVVTTS